MRFIGQSLLHVLGSALLFVTGAVTAQQEEVTYYHYDALGSPVLATDETGAVKWREAYAPYGGRLLEESREQDCSVNPCESTNSPWENRQFYTGKYDEADTGLTYFGARWYDPSLGRFLSVDPVEFQESSVFSFNRYAYANGNPYKYVDPDGRAVETAWDIFNVALGVRSLASNLVAGNYGAAALDGVGVLVDGVAAAFPFVPAGASSAIRGARDVTKGGERLATGFKGSKGYELKNAPYQKVRNADGEVAGRQYSGHAFDQMQNRGVMPSSVENAIKQGKSSPDPIPGRTRHFDSDNNVTVVSQAKKVVTVMRGKR
ncbi:RHS repeat-associated core domain-containing protein [Congregibacter litoralis]|uniref:RHS repeat protein-associated core domain protein n=1 Tax=Congregibacter litoralis KT71 TaxID=314285 RepID=A4ACT9_9GAMM|nr:RHS repeat-associated core domain-containing protein [Congregibacter litoralis]EAQ96130.1 RHS repeat protein-associated core domain protein [Congregibacter litoralis KT71]